MEFVKADKKLVNNRLKRIEGQIRGLQRMVEEDTYCIDVITQTSAIRNALRGVEDVLLEKHLSSCVITQIKTGEQKKAVTEILKVYKLKK
ncbi:metal-sensitive transcriptional regulator [Candidatus Kaiserbacteria bacterium]|nr:MAG: metal-sensitive transcriptional regulator [Candidatus Kaiserbacteria bacterium]